MSRIEKLFEELDLDADLLDEFVKENSWIAESMDNNTCEGGAVTLTIKYKPAKKDDPFDYEATATVKAVKEPVKYTKTLDGLDVKRLVTIEDFLGEKVQS
ncbi:MAG: hypothetical protein LBP51_04155 [Deferribacteraceae bacterium]|jgi:hypothetical protein|nr:hypothetical protein [Deferribacteraceae bacterium]